MKLKLGLGYGHGCAFLLGFSDSIKVNQDDEEKNHMPFGGKICTGDKCKWLDDYNFHRNCRVVRITLVVTGYSGVATFLSTLGLEEWISLFEEERIDVRFGK